MPRRLSIILFQERPPIGMVNSMCLFVSIHSHMSPQITCLRIHVSLRSICLHTRLHLQISNSCVSMLAYVSTVSCLRFHVSLRLLWLLKTVKGMQPLVSILTCLNACIRLYGVVSMISRVSTLAALLTLSKACSLSMAPGCDGTEDEGLCF